MTNGVLPPYVEGNLVRTPSKLFGNRANHGGGNLHRRGLLLVSLDLSKFLDSIEWGLIDGLAKRLGMPDPLRKAFMSFLSNLQRKLKIGDTFSAEWFYTTCGTPQGDAMSIIWANLTSVILARVLAAQNPRVDARIYVDDRYLWVNSIRRLRRTLALVKEYDCLCRSRLNPDKTRILATSTHLRKKAREVLFDGHPLSVVHHLKGLGCTMSSCLKPSHADSDARALKALDTAKKAKRTLAPWKFRKRVIACKMCPQLCYGAAFSKPRVGKLRKLRTAVVSSIWGRGRSKRAPELVLCVCTDPLRSDPEFAVAAETILSVLRFVHRHPCDLHRIWMILNAHLNQPVASRGARSNFPIRRLLGAVKVLGATLSGEGVFSHPAIPDVVLYHVNVKEFVPLLRDVTRYQLAANLAKRSRKVTRTGRVQRTDFSTLEPRIDWDATLSLIREPFDEEKQTGLTQDQSKALTVILTGAQRTMDRLFRHKEPFAPGLPPVSSPRCPWCEEECDETPSHLFWRCDAFHHIRSPYLDRIALIQNRSPGSIPVENWEATCKNNLRIPAFGSGVLRYPARPRILLYPLGFLTLPASVKMRRAEFSSQLMAVPLTPQLGGCAILALAFLEEAVPLGSTPPCSEALSSRTIKLS